MCFELCRHYQDRDGEWAYRSFDLINNKFFDGTLAWPHIRWAMTQWGRCLGYKISQVSPKPSPPSITLHPNLLGTSSGKDELWGYPAACLGYAFAWDTIFHEALHIKVAQMNTGGPRIDSHNNDFWIAEVNRLAPLVGLPGIVAARSVTRRQDGKVVRVCDGNVSYKAVARFPQAVRFELGRMDWYRPNNHEVPTPVTSPLFAVAV